MQPPSPAGFQLLDETRRCGKRFRQMVGIGRGAFVRQAAGEVDLLSLLPRIPPQSLKLLLKPRYDIGIVQDHQVLVVGVLGAVGSVVEAGGH